MPPKFVDGRPAQIQPSVVPAERDALEPPAPVHLPGASLASYTISPVISAIMTASVITELEQQFQTLLNGGTPADDTQADDGD